MAYMVDFAAAYARKFHAVVPCGAWTFTGRDGKTVDMWKRPLIKNWTEKPLRTEGEARRYWADQWYTHHQTPLIAVATGQACGGYIVVDLDKHEDRGIDGYRHLKEWERRTGLYLPENTWTGLSGSGGVHLWFHTDKALRSFSNADIGVDLRADGGCIIVAPSLHPSGNRYQWEAGYSPNDMDCAQADEAVIQFISECRPNGSEYRASVRRGECEGERKMLLPPELPEGGRHTALISLIGTMNRLGVSDAAIEAAVRIENNLKCRPPLDENELQKTIFSAIYRWEKGVNADQWKEKADFQKEQNIMRSRQLRARRCLKS